MNLSAGSRLGAYEIVGAIGSGGMGDVYRARDTRLGRDVALKFLPDDLALDPDRRARFDREARALAALNHPGIVSIYAIETEGGQPFIAMECVEGRVLTDVIPKGGLPLDRLLAMATQVAGAVAAAHTHGIVHRDVKPANVMVGPRDVVKVLDFGIAKALDANASRATAETVAPAQDITGEGRIVGTVAYMSPEQAEGRAVDARSDIFSLGVLFYEMAVGERPFKGDTSLSVLSAILRDTPRPLLEVNPSLPRELARVVRRCLAKDPDDRYQSAADLRSDLDDLRQASHAGELRLPASSSAPSKARSRRWTLAAGLAVAALSGLAGVAWRGSSAAVAPSAPRMTFSRLTLLDGAARQPMISPDGKWVAYVSDVSGNPDIYLQSTTGETAINLTKDSPAADTAPAFSADGERIAFRSERDGGGLFVMGRTGESVRRLTRSGFYPAWFPDGRRLAFVSAGQSPTAEARGGGISELWTVDATGGEPQRVSRGDAVQPRVSPNGRRIAFWAMQPNEDFTGFANPNRDVWTVAIDGTNPVRVTTDEATDWNPVWSPDGTALYFLSNRSGSMNLWRVGIDEGTGATTGEAQALTAPTSYVRHFSLSADGRLGTYANWATTINLARIRIDARAAVTRGPTEAVTTGPRDFQTFDVHDDGQVVLMTSVTQQEDLLMAATGSGLSHLLNDRYRDRNPRWTLNGRQVLFYSDREQNYEIYSIDRDGGGLRQLTDTGGKRFYPVPSRDGSKVLAADITSYELFVYDARDFSKAPDRLPALAPELRGQSFIPLDWSPDGRSLSGVSDATVWVYAFETRAYRRVGTGGASTAQWFPDGRRLLIGRQGRVYALDVETGAEREVLAIAGEEIRAARLSPDGNWLYFLHGSASGDIWTVRFDHGSAEAGK
jgi:serine/threonine protein kinase/Tol biopolymer transport system component